MASEREIRLASWPTCFECLSWSADMSIAAAIGDAVAIFSPNLQFNHIGSRNSQHHVKDWHELRLDTNTFTEEELPYVDPEPFAIFSVGEEQSPNLVASLAWSPSGLAKYHRCALAVLTTNHVLSIWAADANPSESRSWKRVLVINDVLHHFFMNEAPLAATPGESQASARVRSRIQAFTWGTSLQDALSPSEIVLIDAESLAVNALFLALSNDANEIVIVQVLSPYAPFKSRGRWNAKVVSNFHVEQSTTQIRNPATLYTRVFRPNYPIRQLAMTSWVFSGREREKEQRRLCCTLAYVAGTELNIRRCEVKLGINHQPFTIEEKPLVIPGVHVGALQWSYEVDSGRACLLTFTNEEILCIAIDHATSTFSRSAMSISAHSRNDCWDQIGGAACVVTDQTGLTLNYMYHMSTTLNGLRSLKWPITKQTNEFSPRWVQQLAAITAEFDSTNNLAGHVAVRTWGITSSIVGGYVALCVTLHPSDMVQYAMNSDEEAILIVAKESNLPLSSCCNPSTESCMFDIARWIADRMHTGVLPKEDIELLERQLDLAYPDIRSVAIVHDIPSKIHDESFRIEALQRLKTAVNPQASLVERIRQHIRRLAGESDSSPREESHSLSSIRQRLCSAIIDLSPQLYKATQQSQKMLNMYQECHMRLRQILEPASELPLPSEVKENPEQCEICDFTIPFKDFVSACCANGHRFDRCGLTFLAIQSPGITKRCGICSQRYMTEEYMHAQEENGKPHLQPSTGVADANGDADMEASDGIRNNPIDALTELLIAAFPVCIYCGGKFVGTSLHRLLMDSNLGIGGRPARLIAGSRRLSPLQVSFSPSAQQIPTFVPSPNSPTKSIYGTIMDDPHVVEFGPPVLPSASQPRLPELERNPPLRHPQHQYQPSAELLPEEKYPSEYRSRSLDFFDVSDSNDVDDSLPQTAQKTTLDNVPHEDTAHLKTSTMTGPMEEMIDVDFAPRSSQVEQYLELTSPDPANQLYQRHNESTPPVPKTYQSDLDLKNTDYFRFDTNSRPASDSYLQNHFLQRNNLWSFPIPHTQRQNIYQAQPPNISDPINSVEAITIQAFQALRAISRDGHNSSVKPIQYASQHHDSSLENLLRPPQSELTNLLISTRVQPYEDATLTKEDSRSAESPATTRTKRVSFPPPPLLPLPKPNNFEPPLVHTPYPFAPPTTQLTQLTNFPPPSPAPKSPSTPSPFHATTSLALSVHRGNGPRGQRTVYIPIPPAVAATFTASSTHQKSEQHFASLDFDDAALFRELRKQYYSVLLGDSRAARWWRRWCSARRLTRVTVVGGDESPGRQGSGDVYLAERLLERFRRPGKGKGRYAWVHWAQRLAGIGVDRRRRSATDGTFRNVWSGSIADQGELASRPEMRGEGLEFVEGWSAARISLAMSAVVVASILALLLWVFLGPDGGGLSGALGIASSTGRSGRVATGVLIGLLVLVLGCGGVGVWIGVTWVVM